MDHSFAALVCHSNRLLAECLALTLTQSKIARCQVLDMPLDSAASLTADILLIDASLPHSDFSRVVEHCRRGNHNCRILLLVPNHTTDRVLDFAKLGAQGCIFEGVSLDDLREALRHVMDGQTYCSPQIANALFASAGRVDGEHPWAKHLDDAPLTARERDVLELIAWERLGNKQIGRRLRISQYTVKNHVHNILEKLGAEDRFEAADVAMRRNLLVTATR